jgi:hypothetical protein
MTKEPASPEINTIIVHEIVLISAVPRQNSIRPNLARIFRSGVIKYRSYPPLGGPADRESELGGDTLPGKLWLPNEITSRIGRIDFRSPGPGVGSGGQVIAVVQAAQS